MTGHCIAIGSDHEPRKFFNRKTQGFTDISVGKDNLYTEMGAKRLFNSGEPFKIWRAMSEQYDKEDPLVLWHLPANSPKLKAKQSTPR